MSAEWMWNPRWARAHLVLPDRAPHIAAHTTVHGVTGCGRHVNADTLQAEPTGIDTLDRCARCREYAAEHDLDGAS